MATRGALGGLARATADLARLLDAAGRDCVLIETVGVGQDEVEIARLAQVTVVVLVPGMGDDVQAIKAGIMEIADIFVINKADHARRGARGAGTARGRLRRARSSARWRPKARASPNWLRNRADRHSPSRDRQASGLPPPSPSIISGSPSATSMTRSRFYEALGLAVAQRETVAAKRSTSRCCPLGESRIELLEPTAPGFGDREIPREARRRPASRRAARAGSRRRRRAAASRRRAPAERTARGRGRPSSTSSCIPPRPEAYCWN